MKSLQVTYASNIWNKSKGLLGTKKPYPLLLKTHWGIHTFGMIYAIDVVILDSHQTVVKLKQNLHPNSIFLWNPKHEIVLELPEGFVKKNKLEVGEKIKLDVENDL
jgi:uncharacterized membrane protein (UPF0127 family)